MLRQISQSIFLSILSGILLNLPYINGNLWIFSWIGFIPLFFALKNKTRMQAFLLSCLTGIIFWSGTAWWLVHVTLIGTILLILYLALYFGLFGLLTSPYLLSTTYYLLFIPSAWVLLEYLRSHLLTGFPWALLGYSQYLNMPVIQIADITGVWGVSFLVMIVNVTIYSLIAYRPSLINQIKKYSLPALFLATALIYGYSQLNLTPKTGHRTPLKISIIQGNIPQDLKWERQARGFIIGRYINLTLEAAKDKPDLIIWPEASLPVVAEQEPFYYERVKDLVKEIKTPLLLGAVTLRDGRYYNSALLISRDANNLDIYDKLHLVPFGEYIPLRKILGFLETVVPIGEITPGKVYKVFDHPAKFSVLICFEDLFPALSRRFVKEGAGILVNITNDAWYKESPAPYQHLQASVLRAVENRVFLVRAANTGISCFIAPNGEIISGVRDKSGKNIFVTGYRTQAVYMGKSALSFYTRFGDIFILLLFILFAYGIFRRPSV
jgi:apolipoprotein N-acyltransferase